MIYREMLIAFIVLLFLSVLLFLEIGHRMGLRRLKKDPNAPKVGFGAIEGAIFGLLGLLIAFTFSGAASRLDARKQLIVQESNAIGTAYLRLDVLPAAAQPALKENFRKYVDSRLEMYRALPDVKAATVWIKESQRLQGEIWSAAVAACREGVQPAAILVLPALNQMIDITSTRMMAFMIHPPLVVYVMLICLALICATLATYSLASTKRRNWLHWIGFAVIITVTISAIIDIEFPRAGFIRLDAADKMLIDLRENLR